MLSLGSRDEGRKGLGLGFRSREGAMEENELEEGEAFSVQEDDSCIDPDIALSYIDEKIQDVLGHFQKDFEGGVSAENLGAKFGGYGSFLPAHQRSPSVLSQPKSPPRPPNNAVTKSPYNSSIEHVRQDLSASRSAPVSKNNTGSAAQPSSSGRKESCLNLVNAAASETRLECSSKSINGSDQKSLKVRIKVGSDNSLTKNNAAIYSGLGLDTPPSSPEDGPAASPALSQRFRDTPAESPSTIFEAMTSFPVPGGCLLSPLDEKLVQLSENNGAFSRKTGVPRKGMPEMTVVPSMDLPVRDTRACSDKKTKLDEVGGRSREDGYLTVKGNTTKMLKKEADRDFDPLSNKRFASNELNIQLQACSRSSDPKDEYISVADSMKGTTKEVGISNEINNKPSGQNKVSLPDSFKDAQCVSIGGVKIGGIANLGNGITHFKANLNPKTNVAEKELEEKTPRSHKETVSDSRRERKSKNHKNRDINKFNFNESNDLNDHAMGNAEPMKQMHAQKISSHEKDSEKMLQGNDSLYLGKKKQKGSQDKSAPSFGSTQENLRASSVVTKEKKKSSHARVGHPENKGKMSKSRKETSRTSSRDSRRVTGRNINAERVEIRAELPDSFTSSEKPMDRSAVKKDANLYPELIANSAIITSSICAEAAAPALGATAGSEAPPPVVINENWVCCDKCQKWRLLPYGTDPAHLPMKWKCSMQVWLPGLNSCSISEDETTKAFNALYLVPAPETGANLNGHHDIAATSNNPQYLDGRPDHNTPSVQTTGRKKFGQSDGADVSKSSASKKNLQGSVKSRSLNDVNEDPLETNSSGKGSRGLSSKLTDLTTQKHNNRQNQKHEIPGRYSDGGDVGRSDKYSKSKSKRESNQDEPRISKKSKKEDHFVEDWRSDLAIAGKEAPNMHDNTSTKAPARLLQNYSDHSSSKDSKNELKGSLSTSAKKSKAPAAMYSNNAVKEKFRTSDVEKSVPDGYAGKKRKVKEWQESMGHQENVLSPQHSLDNRPRTKEAFSETEPRKQKKAKVFKCQDKESSMSNLDEKVDKKGRAARILLSGNGEQHVDEVHVDGRGVAGKEQMGQYQETIASRQAPDGVDSSKRDVAYPLLPTAATSSSSKVSGSRKSKGKFQEARGSPVESVSSSPLRTSTAEKFSTKKISMANDHVVNLGPSFTNLGPSFTGSPKRCSDGEFGSDQSGTQRKGAGPFIQLISSESVRAVDSGGLGSVAGACHYTEKEASLLSGGNNKDEPCLRRVSPADFEDTNAVGRTENIVDDDCKYPFEGTEKDNIDGEREKFNNCHRPNGSSQWKSGKNLSERNRISNSNAERGKLKAPDSLGEKKELHSPKNTGNCRSEENCSLLEKDGDYAGKKNSSAKWSRSDRKNNHFNNGLEEKLDAQHRDLTSRVIVTGASCKSNSQENLSLPPFPSESLSSHAVLNRIETEAASERGISQSSELAHDKNDARVLGSQSFPSPMKGSRSEQYTVNAVNGEALGMVKQPRKPDSQNCMKPSSLRQVHLSGNDSSPMRKDGSSIANLVLKEARDLKHTANRLKNEGLGNESIGLYFEAALKFLHHAFLLEPPSAESAKHGEIYVVQMYSETAKLCEYCALEYEKCQDMAAAALAYKCVEVAYMKVAYYKHPGASKDRHELLSTLQTVLPGESPSSSASDVDNLNNQGVLDKAASAKAVGSPNIAGNHVIAARNRPNFMRLLNFTNDLNCAFDATKRSQNAIAVASLDLEKYGADGMSSVRKVLDFNFQNVEGLLRLVRLSLESISH